jgi:hypothetical protein
MGRTKNPLHRYFTSRWQHHAAECANLQNGSLSNKPRFSSQNGSNRGFTRGNYR